MKIRDKLAREPRTFSFEFSPPRTPDAVARLFETAERLRALEPAFVSVTYGAGGSTRRNTIDVVVDLQTELGLTAAAHLTCVGHSRLELADILRELAARGIENLMLLRGDPPHDQPSFAPAPDGPANAWELVTIARSVGDFSIGVAGYPEGHQECPDRQLDLEHLKHKVDCGADFVVTQLFFRNADYFSFVERARTLGIRCRIVPGIMPALSWPQIQRMAERCGASIPDDLAAALRAAGDDRARSERIGIDWATAQCEELLVRGAPGIHLYTLNQSRAAEEIFAHLRERVASLLPRMRGS
ncbi:MAG: methylenetetrahydrofolate reductase [NAD(P)H] [Candidatus Binatia bacterium]|jgi:methylenetetrahydrofolate reductase (NADH)